MRGNIVSKYVVNSSGEPFNDYDTGEEYVGIPNIDETAVTTVLFKSGKIEDIGEPVSIEGWGWKIVYELPWAPKWEELDKALTLCTRRVKIESFPDLTGIIVRYVRFAHKDGSVRGNGGIAFGFVIDHKTNKLHFTTAICKDDETFSKAEAHKHIKSAWMDGNIHYIEYDKNIGLVDNVQRYLIRTDKLPPDLKIIKPRLLYRETAARVDKSRQKQEFKITDRDYCGQQKPVGPFKHRPWEDKVV